MFLGRWGQAFNSVFLKIGAASVSGGPLSIPGFTVQWRAINHSAAVSRCLYYSYDHTQKQRSSHRTHSTGSYIIYTIFEFHNKHYIYRVFLSTVTNKSSITDTIVHSLTQFGYFSCSIHQVIWYLTSENPEICWKSLEVISRKKGRFSEMAL